MKKTAWAWRLVGTDKKFAQNYGNQKYGALKNAVFARSRNCARRNKHPFETVVKVSLGRTGKPNKVIGRG